MDHQKETRIRHTASDAKGKTEISVQVEMYGVTDEQEDRVRKMLNELWKEVEKIAEENEGG